MSNIKFLSPVSSCLHPGFRKYVNAYDNSIRVTSYPCGKCWNCIQSFRDSWRIRIYQSMIWSRCSKPYGFIYDTLTLSPAAMPTVSAHDYFTGESVVPLEHLHNDRIWEIINHYDGRVPFFAKETFSHFIKMGRDNYNYFYRSEIKKGFRPRCPLKVFAALEYGPKWGRPHVHLCAFGVSYADWCRFWAKPWRKSMGFTKTKFIDLRGTDRVTTTEHCSRISTYISKYLLKGSYDNPLVLAGIVPKAWRVISHGIGEEMFLYDSSRFRWLLDDIKFNMGNRVPVDGNTNSEVYQDIVNYCQKFRNLSPEQVDSLKTYVENGYKFALPRYYSGRLLAVHSKGLAGCAVKTALLEDAQYNCFEEILQYASDCAFYPELSGDRLRAFLEHDLRAFNFVAFRYRSFKKVENLRKANWHRLQTLNTQKRLFAKKNTGDVGLII